MSDQRSEPSCGSSAARTVLSLGPEYSSDLMRRIATGPDAVAMSHGVSLNKANPVVQPSLSETEESTRSAGPDSILGAPLCASLLVDGSQPVAPSAHPTTARTQAVGSQQCAKA